MPAWMPGDGLNMTTWLEYLKMDQTCFGCAGQIGSREVAAVYRWDHGPRRAAQLRGMGERIRPQVRWHCQECDEPLYQDEDRAGPDQLVDHELAGRARAAVQALP
jgi:hypothetical protein